ncbi:hypothetical protein Ade02nite_75670 [Paractinoplanes deccanensis]|uniref:Uncharacterized protein n=1 Tax=Paractinoplanes deccanensis TaxID=113561 RepID=A0ABQ3YG11_9ACTN|nr:hypothetical protein Ade02nite_75670 [Actinoplanes deccanensis]
MEVVGEPLAAVARRLDQENQHRGRRDSAPRFAIRFVGVGAKYEAPLDEEATRRTA